MHKLSKSLHTIIRYVVSGVLLALCCSLLPYTITVYADNDLSDAESDYFYYTNEATQYQVVLEDEADLLSVTEEKAIFELMQSLTEYGHVAFKSVDSNPSSTESFAESFYHNVFGTDSGTIFVIDMDNRYLYIFSDGSMYRTITKSVANIITDNVYSYASDEDYYTCVYETFSQIQTKMEGGRIAQPMKYASNAFLAILLALLINYFLVKITSKARKASSNELLANLPMHCEIMNANTLFTHQTKRYDPPSSSSGGHGGGGGGGRSGGGGGHRF